MYFKRVSVIYARLPSQVINGERSGHQSQDQRPKQRSDLE
jgi:hypothetical protein